MPANTHGRSIRVGALVTSAAIVLMVFLFFIGSEQKIFSRKNEYKVHLIDASGLAEGNPVKISGVTVGTIRDIYLPQDPKQREVTITLVVARKYADRIREDSRARLKKLGLLAGDSYIEISPGNPRFAKLEPGSTIPAARQTNVDQLLSSGEDLVDNLVQISYSMKNILSRVNRGEGLLGELTSSPETKQRVTDTVLSTLNRTNAVLEHIESGRGLLGRMIYDDKYGDELTTSLAQSAASLRVVTASLQKSFENNQGTIPALLNDPESKKKIFELVDNLRTTSANLAAFSASMQKGEGIVPRLLNDKQYGDQTLAEFSSLVHQLNDAVGKLNSGQGTAGKLINDPSVYESINDILIGINESRLLRWLVRNRQEAGIEQRVQTQESVVKTNPPAATGTIAKDGTSAITTTSPPPPKH